MKPFIVDQVRQDFPIFQITTHGKPLCYLDTANSAQKPQVVIDTMSRFYAQEYANVHRGIYELSQNATQLFEDARANVRAFINARNTDEIIFTRGTTESINLVAHSLGGNILKSGDTVLVSAMEHHSNIVPWQLITERVGARLAVAPFHENGELDLKTLKFKLHELKPKILAITHISNSLGTINPIKEITAVAHTFGTLVVVDGAQAAPHTTIDVQSLDCDFYTFSGHKMYGPTGTGVLYGKLDLLKAMPPYHGGGEMIDQVRFEVSTYKEPPARFEAGTPNIAGAVGLSAALKYFSQFSLTEIQNHEHALCDMAQKELSSIPGVRFLSRAPKKASILTCVIEGVHSLDFATLLDQEGVAIRVGHHCAQPVMESFGIKSSIRVSFGMYNTVAEVNQFIKATHKAVKLLR